MRQLLTIVALTTLFAVPASAQLVKDGQKVADPAHGTTGPEAGVSSTGSKTVVPEIPANKKPNMETIKDTGKPSSSTGASSGTSGSSAPAPSPDPSKPASE
jgi:hypothetical protein